MIAARTSGTTTRGMAYRRHGSGPPVVLVHGWCLSSVMWTYQQELLADRYTVLSPDLPGFGASAGLAGPYTIERHAEELASFCAELGLEAPAVVGFAFGAAVTLTLAAMPRPAVRPGRLVLIGMPTASGGSPFARMPGAMRRDWPQFARRSAQAICRQAQSEATIAWLERMFVGTHLLVALETVGELARFEPGPIAPAVDVPTLVVQGAQDDVAPLAAAERWAAGLARGRLEVIPDAGHLVLLDQKDAFDRALAAFLAGG